MPRPKISDSLVSPEVEAEVLAMIKAKLREGGTPLTADEERDFLERRARGLAAGTIQRHEYKATFLRGQWVYREAGRHGRWLSVPPYYLRLLEQRRDFDVVLSKMQRASQLAARNRQRLPRKHGKDDRKHALILGMLATLWRLPERNRASVAARLLGIPVRTVRHVAALAKKNGKNP